MPKPLELRKVKRILKKYGIIYVTGKGRHPKFYDPETNLTYPIKSHGKKTLCALRAFAVQHENR
jgi:predicted RNA binding protein YcfA (HicA-like mRNA interferase family)